MARATAVLTGNLDPGDGGLLSVECGYTRGFAGIQLIGNTSQVCRDGLERARSALETLGFRMPTQRVVVSLAPADVRKDGNHLDLPMAVSLGRLLDPAASGHAISGGAWLMAAELALDGGLRPVRGIVAFLLAAVRHGLAGVVMARANLAEAGAVVLPGAPERRLTVLGFEHLGEVLHWLRTGAAVAGVACPVPPSQAAIKPDFDDMLLTPKLTRVALAAAAGRHSLLLRGSPGTGKSMLAARLPSILPEIEGTELVEVMRVHSAISERLPPALLAGCPPFRAPHHQASAPAVIGSVDYPGEMALAHGGVLFLDELPEFRRDVLEALREPLETGEVRVARVRRRVVWQARTMLIAACNNCPCGWSGSARRRCLCPTPKLLAYRARLSGPILERIDIHCNMPEADESGLALYARLAACGSGSTTQDLKRRVAAARSFAAARQARLGVGGNRELPAGRMVTAMGLRPEAFTAMVAKVIPPAASARSTLRALRVARTLADLDGESVVSVEQIAEAWSWQVDAAAVERGEMLPV